MTPVWNNLKRSTSMPIVCGEKNRPFEICAFFSLKGTKALPCLKISAVFHMFKSQPFDYQHSIESSETSAESKAFSFRLYSNPFQSQPRMEPLNLLRNSDPEWEIFDERKQVFLRMWDISEMIVKIHQIFGGCLITGPHSQIPVPRCIWLCISKWNTPLESHVITTWALLALGKGDWLKRGAFDLCNFFTNGDSLVFSELFFQVDVESICWCDH